MLSVLEPRSQKPEAVDNQSRGKAVRGEEPTQEKSSIEAAAKSPESEEPGVVDEQPDLTNGLLQSSGESFIVASLQYTQYTCCVMQYLKLNISC